MPVDEVRAPVDRVERLAERRRQPWILNVEHAGTRSAAVVGERGDDLIAEVLEERRIAVLPAGDEVIQPDVPAAAVVRITAREQVHERVNRQVVVVARAPGIDLEAAAITPDADVAAAAHLHFPAVGADGLYQPVVTDGDIEPAVAAHLDAIDRVIGAAEIEAEAKPAHEHTRLVGNAVVVGVAVGSQIRGMRDIERVAVKHRPARAVHRREHGVLVGLAVVVAIHEPQDAAHAGIRLQRAVAIDADEELAGERRRDARRIVDDWAARRTP